MAHSFIKPETFVSMGLGLLRRELLLARLVKRMGIDDFRGAQNDTVNVRIPAILTAREYAWRNNRASAITADDLEELSIPITLDHHIYSAVNITDEEMTLDIKSFGEQVLTPQMRAVAEKLESMIATAMDGGTYHTTINFAGSGDFWNDVIVPARKALNLQNVPAEGRVLVLGADLEAEALTNELFKRVDESGSSETLRNATLGRLGGFTVIGNVNSIESTSGYAFHPTAYAFANVAPTVPNGVTFGATRSWESLAMRYIQDYDPTHLMDRSVVSAFAGAASIEDGRNTDGELTGENVRAVKIDFYGAS